MLKEEFTKWANNGGIASQDPGYISHAIDVLEWWLDSKMPNADIGNLFLYESVNEFEQKLNQIRKDVDFLEVNRRDQRGRPQAALNRYMEFLKEKGNTTILYKKKYVTQNMRSTEYYKELLLENYNIILHGAPGTGKTHLAKDIAKSMGCTDNEIGFVQFHPSYDYTDFVEGLRPNDRGTFDRIDGIFKKFCLNAIECNEEKKFVFIIDEINRGEISKIFGELFFSIDPGYRGLDENGTPKGLVKTQYQNLVDEEDIFSEGFYIPDNVYIIGTMNDIDRSVESMDFAMRRRFIFEEVTAEDSAENMGLSDDAKEIMKRINDIISKTDGLNEAYEIGGAYFLYVTDYGKLWKIKLSSLIKEYLRGIDDDCSKFKKIKEAYFNNQTEEFSESDYENSPTVG